MEWCLLTLTLHQHQITLKIDNTMTSLKCHPIHKTCFIDGKTWIRLILNNSCQIKKQKYLINWCDKLIIIIQPVLVQDFNNMICLQLILVEVYKHKYDINTVRMLKKIMNHQLAWLGRKSTIWLRIELVINNQGILIINEIWWVRNVDPVLLNHKKIHLI